MKEKSVKKLLALKSSIHNDACAVGPRWAARCGVLGRARMPAYERGLRPCLAVAHRTPTTKAIMNRALKSPLLLAEIRLADLLVLAQRLRVVVQRNVARLEDVAAVRHVERHQGVLL